LKKVGEEVKDLCLKFPINFWDIRYF
jgi:hypothetical protein